MCVLHCRGRPRVLSRRSRFPWKGEKRRGKQPEEPVTVKKKSKNKAKTPKVDGPPRENSKQGRYAWSNPWVIGLEKLHTKQGNRGTGSLSGEDVPRAPFHHPLSPIHEESVYTSGSVGGSQARSREYEALGTKHAYATVSENAEPSSSNITSPRILQVHFLQTPHLPKNTVDGPYGSSIRQGISVTTSNASLQLGSPYTEDSDTSSQIMTPTFDHFPSPPREIDQDPWPVQSIISAPAGSSYPIRLGSNSLQATVGPRHEEIVTAQ